MERSTDEPLAFNLHITAACNMDCGHCHSSFRNLRPLPASDWCKVIDQIAGLKNSRRPGKITFAGGEPLMIRELAGLIHHAKAVGQFVSVITNGSLVGRAAQDGTLAEVDEIGVSLDALEPKVCRAIGRCLEGGMVVDYEGVCETIHRLGKRLKLNTVVCRANLDTRLTGFVTTVRPERWKVLQMRWIPGENDRGRYTTVTPREFRRFVRRNRRGLYRGIPFAVETDVDQEQAYLMIDPSGELFDAAGAEYHRSQPVLEVGLAAAMTQIRFDYARFLGRGGAHFSGWTMLGPVPARSDDNNQKGIRQ